MSTYLLHVIQWGKLPESQRYGAGDDVLLFPQRPLEQPVSHSLLWWVYTSDKAESSAELTIPSVLKNSFCEEKNEEKILQKKRKCEKVIQIS